LLIALQASRGEVGNGCHDPYLPAPGSQHGISGHNRAGDERRWDRGSWIALGVVLVFFLWTLPQAIVQLRLPTDGCLIDTVDFDTPDVLYCFATWDT
jgi:hypothetical protein